MHKECFQVQKHGLGKANGGKLVAVAQKSENTKQANQTVVVNAIQWSEPFENGFYRIRKVSELKNVLTAVGQK